MNAPSSAVRRLVPTPAPTPAPTSAEERQQRIPLHADGTIDHAWQEATNALLVRQDACTTARHPCRADACRLRLGGHDALMHHTCQIQQREVRGSVGRLRAKRDAKDLDDNGTVGKKVRVGQVGPVHTHENIRVAVQRGNCRSVGDGAKVDSSAA